MDQGIVSLRLRKARVGAPGALHHIIIRGIERKPIFKDKINYGNFTLLMNLMYVVVSGIYIKFIKRVY